MGLEPTTKEGPVHEEFVELDAGGLTFSLHGGYEGKVHGGRPVALHFEVEDIFETVKRLRDLGHEVGEPQKMEYGVYETSFRDPDGNEFDLTQPPALKSIPRTPSLSRQSPSSRALWGCCSPPPKAGTPFPRGRCCLARSK